MSFYNNKHEFYIVYKSVKFNSFISQELISIINSVAVVRLRDAVVCGLQVLGGAFTIQLEQ